MISVNTTSSSSFETIANNTLFSYPITLNSKKCYPSDLQDCIDSSTTIPDTHCCKELFSKNTEGPGETIPNDLLVFLVMVLPFLLIIIRFFGVVV